VGSAAAWLAVIFIPALTLSPIGAEAQQAAKIARIGYMTPNLADWPHTHEAFRQGLRDLGYVEGRNVVIEYRTPRVSSSGSPLLRPN
jgi:hypothetical protein